MGDCGEFCPFAQTGIVLSFARLRMRERLRCDGACSRLEISHKCLKNLQGRDLIDGLDLVVVKHTEEDLLLELLGQFPYTLDTTIKRF